MPPIIDRRLNPSGKNLVNRQKFLRRAKENIRRTVKESVTNKQLKDIGKGENVKINAKDLRKPTFRRDPELGDFEGVFPGNEQYEEGDWIPKPRKGQSGRGRKAGGPADAEDDFIFTLSRDEFIDYLFEDLELPDFVKQSLNVATAEKPAREGFTNTGSPANLNVEQTFKNSIGRRLALGRPTDEQIAELEEAVNKARSKKAKEEAIAELEAALNRRKIIPYIDDTDLKYNYWTKKPEKISKAVMFCLMDVSGSMGETEKDIAKRFFLLLYLFLERQYKDIEIRFIRHTTDAEEVDEQTFFYDTQSGGTMISSGLMLIKELARSYNTDEVNMYIAQCTDGDNYASDNELCDKLIREDLLPIVQYFAYIQVQPYERNVIFDSWTAWPTYQTLSDEFEKLVCTQILNQNEVWQVFRKLFERVG